MPLGLTAATSADIELDTFKVHRYIHQYSKKMKFSDSLTFNAAPELQGHYLAYDGLKEAIYRLERQQVSESRPGDLESAGLLSANVSNSEEDSAVRIFRALLNKELDSISQFFQKEESDLLKQVQEVTLEIEAIERSDWINAEQEDKDSDAESVDSQTGRSRNIAKRVLANLITSSTKPSHRRHRSPSTHRKRPRAQSNASDQSGDEAPLVESVVENGNGHSAPATRKRRLSMASSLDQSISIWTSNSDWAFDTKITFKLRLQNLFRELTQLKQYISLNQTGFRKILKKY